jgi:hypothetical protein
MSLKLEAHGFKGTYGISPLDQTPDADGKFFTEEKWTLFTGKITVIF